MDKKAFSVVRNPEMENSTNVSMILNTPQLTDSPRKPYHLTRTIHSQNDTFFSKEENLDSKLSTARKIFEQKQKMNKFKEKQIIDKIIESVAETEIRTELAFRKADGYSGQGEDIVEMFRQSMGIYAD